MVADATKCGRRTWGGPDSEALWYSGISQVSSSRWTPSQKWGKVSSGRAFICKPDVKLHTECNTGVMFSVSDPKERWAFSRGSQSSFMFYIMNVGFILALAFPPHMRTEIKGLMKWMCSKSEFMQNDNRENMLLIFPPAKVGGQRPGQRRQPHPLSCLRGLTVYKELVPSIL